MFYFFSSINSLCQTCQLYRFLELHNSNFKHWNPFRISIVSFYKFCTKQTLCLPTKRCLTIGFIVKVHYMKMKNRCYTLLRICEISPTIFMDKNFILQVLKVTWNSKFVVVDKCTQTFIKNLCQSNRAAITNNTSIKLDCWYLK